MKRHQVVFISLVLFVTGLALRLPGLGSYLTPDEDLWSGRTAQFMTALSRHDWARTTLSGHPGVTTTWLGSTGVVLKWFLARPPETPTLRELALDLEANPVRLDMLPWLRLPVAVVCALGTVVIYRLARRLFCERVALLGAAYLLLDPFWLAHSKIIHLDGLLTAAMTIAWLALLVAQKTRARHYYVLSGLALGVAILTKSPSLVLLPLVAVSILLARGRAAANWRAAIGDIVLDGLWLGLPAVIVMLALWPALWVAPVRNLSRVIGLMVEFAQTGHEQGNFWLGKPTDVPGPLFYPAALVWRSMPFTLLGLMLAAVLSLWALLRNARRQGEREPVRPDWQPPWALWGFILWFGIVLSTGDKKFDRYLLPVFPALDLLAAWAWVTAIRGLARRFPLASGMSRDVSPSRVLWIGAVLLVAAQAPMDWGERPSYLTAYNPLVGGIGTAQHVLLVGWGEGLEEAAAYLNRQEDANTKQVASWYAQNVFEPFFRGHTYDIIEDGSAPGELYRNDVDYVVTYINLLQRDKFDHSSLERLGAPLYEVVHQGVKLAQVYRWPKPYAHTMDRTLGNGLRLLGWDLGPNDPSTGGLPLKLYWDQAKLAQATDRRAIVARLKDGGNDVWAQADGEIINDATHVRPGWLEQPAIEQTMVLKVTFGLLPATYRIALTPFAGQELELGEIEISPTLVGDLSGQVTGDWNPLPGEITFGDQLRLIGYRKDTSSGDTAIDLVWLALNAPAAGYKYFVHAANTEDQIVAQHDGCVGQRDCQSGPPWQSGQLIRQRVHLPPGVLERNGVRIYVGIYNPDTGERLPASENGRLLPDGRYELISAQNEG